MPRPRYRLSTLLWITLAVACIILVSAWAGVQNGWKIRWPFIVWRSVERWPSGGPKSAKTLWSDGTLIEEWGGVSYEEVDSAED
jgi:hypothetical protein